MYRNKEKRPDYQSKTLFWGLYYKSSITTFAIRYKCIFYTLCSLICPNTENVNTFLRELIPDSRYYYYYYLSLTKLKLIHPVVNST